MNEYEALCERLRALTEGVPHRVANLANAAAVLFEMNDINWAGFYIAEDETLFLGPFQGKPACTKIPFGKGVCGTAAVRRETVIVDDVDLFPGHIACSAESRSEIVVPVLKNGKVAAVIDVDAPVLSRFGDEEKTELEKIARLLSELF